MNLYTVLELAFLISMTIIFLIITIAVQVSKVTKRFPLLFYLRLTSWFLVLFFVTSIISIIFENGAFARIHFMFAFPITFFFILFFNNMLKESYYTFGFIFSCCLGFLLIFLGTQPNAVKLVVEMGYAKYVPDGLFNIIYIILYLIFLSFMFFWGFKTWLSSPFYYKKKALLCFTGIIIYIGGSIVYIFYYMNPIVNILIYVINLISLLTIVIVIMKEIKILYVLPYTVYRIAVRDNKGNPLYDHDWTDMNITETVFTGFLNAIEIMSKEVMQVGGILDINLNEGILIVNRSEYITVGLLASKASKLLRDCVNNFVKDFENKFKSLLEKSCVDMNEYKSAYEFINKYFSIIPYQNIKNKNQLMTLSYKYHELPKQIENNYKTIFENKEEYEDVLNELIKTPCSNPSEFVDFYNEFKFELGELELKESKEEVEKKYLE